MKFLKKDLAEIVGNQRAQTVFNAMRRRGCGKSRMVLTQSYNHKKNGMCDLLYPGIEFETICVVKKFIAGIREMRSDPIRAINNNTKISYERVIRDILRLRKHLRRKRSINGIFL